MLNVEFLDNQALLYLYMKQGAKWTFLSIGRIAREYSNPTSHSIVDYCYLAGEQIKHWGRGWC